MKYNGHSIHTVWLDLDDTLIDFHANSLDALQQMWSLQPLLQRLFPKSESWTESYLHHNHRLWQLYNVAKITRDYLKTMRFANPLIDAGLPSPQALQQAEILDPLYLDLLARGKKLVAGAPELLQYLRSMPSLNIGILSNGFREVQYRKIESAGIAPYIDMVVLSDHIGINKPDVRIFQHAMSQAGCTEPRSHLMIGDNPDTDIAGAVGAGWHAILYCRDSTAVNNNPQTPTIINLQDLISLLKE